MATHSFSLCPIHGLGGDWCPGCGLGRAMKLMIMGKWGTSWEMHPLAGFAWSVLLIRIFQLIKQLKTKQYYG
ncbi:DUF2752 domain-containing protein [Echinicola jeungdonensis]|nr:DUF2752 domain-containing protein [Echinicola jeungdonensis]MDN3670777.1 DUF2752 domain-containing protein [Echinicola jeungdonensis]